MASVSDPNKETSMNTQTQGRLRPNPDILEVNLRVNLRLDNTEETLEPGHAEEYLAELLRVAAKCAADDQDLAYYIEFFSVEVAS